MPWLTCNVVIEAMPRDPLPTVTWWQRGQERAVTVRLAGREVQAVAVEEYAYLDGRRAYRLRRRDDPDSTRTIRVWWDDAAIRWGWLPPGRDATEAGRWAGGGEVRRRAWTEYEGWPLLWVHIGGRWREAWLWLREDWPDGTVVYEVGVHPDVPTGEGLQRHRYVYDPASVQPREYGVRADGSQA
jgi:hypothetical protein